MNSVHWRHWSPEAFREAEESGRPILLFLSTRWSRGCGEMARVTFRDPRVAAIVSAGFVPIEVNADERPDIADRYALDGYPTTLLLTDAGDVLQGGTYFAPEPLAALLERTARAYRDSRGAIAARAASAREPAGEAEEPSPAARLDAAVPGAIAGWLLSRADPRGGFLGAPKFLHADAVLFLLTYGRRTGLEAAAACARATLDAVAASPLCAPDGRVFRCAAGADWREASDEVTVESHAAALLAFAAGALAFDGDYRDRLRAIAAAAERQWPIDGDRLPTDAGADLARALLAAAGVLGDAALGHAALQRLEAVVLAAYTPGSGVRHLAPESPRLLADHVSALLALLDAHAASDSSPYEMLAEELAHCLRAAFDDAAGALRDRVHGPDDRGRLARPLYPFRQNARAATALARLAAASGEPAWRGLADRLGRWAAARWRAHGLDAAACGSACLDLIDLRSP